MAHTTAVKSPRYRSNHRIDRTRSLYHRTRAWYTEEYNDPYGSARMLGLVMIIMLFMLVIVSCIATIGSYLFAA